MQKYITEDKLKQLQRIKNEIESARHETSFLEFDYLSSAPEALKKAIEKVRAWLDGANVETFTEPDRLMYGRLRTDPRRDHVVGVEGSTEVERLNTVTIEEEV